jgi:hypothetical protein
MGWRLIEALKFADARGLPLNVSIDVAWVFFSGSDDDRTRFAHWQQRLSKWTTRRAPVGKDSSLKTWQGDQWKIGGGL